MPGIPAGRIVKKKTFSELTETDLTTDDKEYCGDEINCERYNRFLLAYDLTETGQMTDGDKVRIVVKFREPNGTWHDYVLGPFGTLYEEESTIPCTLCVSGVCLGERMKVCITTDYTNETPTQTYFTATIRVTLVESG